MLAYIKNMIKNSETYVSEFFYSLPSRSFYCLPHPYCHEKCHEKREEIERAEDRQEALRHDVREGSENNEKRGLQNQPNSMGLHELTVHAGFARPGPQHP